MEDVQAKFDDRDLPIDLVGVKGLRYPVTVRDKARQRQSTIAELSLSVGLPKHYRGTHMSRFVEVIHEHRAQVDMETLPSIVATLRERLEAKRARLEMSFPYFIERLAPVSRLPSLMSYQCRYVAEETDAGNDFVVAAQIPITTLCPCSKAISDYGAHNQRGYVEIAIRATRQPGGLPSMVWIEELVEIGERSGSAPIYPLLKREDERELTMRAYDHPAFVEDVVRHAVGELRQDQRIDWLEVRAETVESIHDHNAFAMISGWRNRQASGDNRDWLIAGTGR
ncbi:MAG: GTP cyclohydrolase FolE2 [Planctomycetota bacterium]|jgi:GTP cyclohydrolase I|nr:GTP cyclohydrolase FolE2 [Planctomycetota bacterium]